MERRQIANRRQEHLFVSNDRRTGPYDRRKPRSRRAEIEAEREKIARIQAYKAKDKAVDATQPLFTTKRLVVVGITLLVLIAILFILN